MYIDSHHHLWRYTSAEYGWIDDSKKILQHDFLPANLQELAQETQLDGFITVQARQTVEETDWLLKLAAENDTILGVVGWAPLDSDELNQSLDKWSSSNWLKAVRHVVQDEPDGFLDATPFNTGVKQLAQYDLAYDVLIYGRQLPEAIRFVDRHPNQRFILDHVAKPTVQAANFDYQWAEHFRELAKRTHVACKFSGLTTEVTDREWSQKTIQPYWDLAWECFGTDRLMYGSDWPVCLLRSSYIDWKNTCQSLSSSLSTDEQTAFWGGSARQWYKLSP